MGSQAESLTYSLAGFPARDEEAEDSEKSYHPVPLGITRMDHVKDTENLILFAVALEKCGPESPKTTISAFRARIEVFYKPFGRAECARFGEEFQQDQ